MPSPHNTLVDPLVQIISEAGQAVMAIYRENFSVYEKSDTSPVTEADRRGEEIIKARLAALAPDIQFIGEETIADSAPPARLERRFWLVDPLDGTKEFIKRGGDFTVNIALIEDSVPVLGLVLAPDQGRLYAGVLGEGAWAADWQEGRVGPRSPVSTRQPAASPLTIVASRSHRSPALEAYLGAFVGAETIAIGSSLKLCLVAEGKADLYPRLGPTCEWDTAAADAVLRAAGGTVLAPDVKPLGYGKDPATFLNSWFIAKGDPALVVPPLPAAP